MRILINSLFNWDAAFVAAIYRWSDHKKLRRTIRWISRSGDGALYPGVGALVFLASPDIAGRFVLAAIIAFAIELPFYKLLKNSVKRKRPYQVQPGLFCGVVPADAFSFPSGHTAAAFLMAFLLASFFPVLAAPVFVWAGLVGFSRVYLGVHYLTDTAAGMLLGVLCAASGLACLG